MQSQFTAIVNDINSRLVFQLQGVTASGGLCEIPSGRFLCLVSDFNCFKQGECQKVEFWERIQQECLPIPSGEPVAYVGHPSLVDDLCGNDNPMWNVQSSPSTREAKAALIRSSTSTNDASNVTSTWINTEAACENCVCTAARNVAKPAKPDSGYNFSYWADGLGNMYCTNNKADQPAGGFTAPTTNISDTDVAKYMITPMRDIMCAREHSDIVGCQPVFDKVMRAHNGGVSARIKFLRGPSNVVKYTDDSNLTFTRNAYSDWTKVNSLFSGYGLREFVDNGYCSHEDFNEGMEWFNSTAPYYICWHSNAHGTAPLGNCTALNDTNHIFDGGNAELIINWTTRAFARYCPRDQTPGNDEDFKIIGLMRPEGKDYLTLQQDFDGSTRLLASTKIPAIPQDKKFKTGQYEKVYGRCGDQLPKYTLDLAWEKTENVVYESHCMTFRPPATNKSGTTWPDDDHIVQPNLASVQISDESSIDCSRSEYDIDVNDDFSGVLAAWAITLIVLGALLVLGGIGYFVYWYFFRIKADDGYGPPFDDGYGAQPYYGPMEQPDYGYSDYSDYGYSDYGYSGYDDYSDYSYGYT